MPIAPSCSMCKKELEEFGGIVLSPPDSNDRVTKDHLCVECYQGIKESFTK